MLRTQKDCLIAQAGLIPYLIAEEKQQQLQQAKIENPTYKDILILLEHPPVYTLGTGSSLDNIKFDLEDKNKQVYRTQRGGEVTYHCPGQLVGYPILDLRHFQSDLHWYLRQLEQVIINLLKTYDLKSDRLPGLTGVWVNGSKVAAIGIKVRKWVTMHGFALNVCPDLQGFLDIIPCGIADKPVGSLAQFLPEITLEQIRQDLPSAFAEVFQVNLESTELDFNSL